jgi:hypothetical protein
VWLSSLSEVCALLDARVLESWFRITLRIWVWNVLLFECVGTWPCGGQTARRMGPTKYLFNSVNYRAIRITTPSVICLNVHWKLYVKNPIKYENFLISNNLYLFTYKLWVPVLVTLHLWSGSLTLVISFHSLLYLNFVFCGPGCSFCIATDYGLNGPWIEPWWWWDCLHTSRSALVPTQPPIQWVPGHSRA